MKDFRIGFHVSIAGGIRRSVERAVELGCTTMQIFTHSPRSWELTDIPPDDAREFDRARRAAGISPVFVHTSYLINIASSKPELYARSIDALRTELLRADAIGAEYVVTHLGSASGSLPEDAMKRVSDALAKTLDRLDVNTMLLLENTAGERGDVGFDFREIGRIMDCCPNGLTGVTMDTCHSYGAGYDMRTKKGLDAFVTEMDDAFGLTRLRLIHLNDSKQPLGSRRDRHEDIGLGEIGKAALGRLINHPKLRDVAFVMETPRSTPEDDVNNMATVMKLRK